MSNKSSLRQDPLALHIRHNTVFCLVKNIKNKVLFFLSDSFENLYILLHEKK